MDDSPIRAEYTKRVREYRRHLTEEAARYSRLPDDTPDIVKDVHEQLRQSAEVTLSYFDRVFKLRNPPQQESFTHDEIMSGYGIGKNEFDRLASERGFAAVGDDNDRYSREDVMRVAGDFSLSWEGREYPADQEFISFEGTRRILGLESEELKILVSAGEIRAYRDGQSMKFKTDAVYEMKERPSTR